VNDRAARLVDVLDGFVLAAGCCFGFPKGGKLWRATLDADGVTPADPCAKGLANETSHHVGILSTSVAMPTAYSPTRKAA
jgi:hypothetical protein